MEVPAIYTEEIPNIQEAEEEPEEKPVEIKKLGNPALYCFPARGQSEKGRRCSGYRQRFYHKGYII